MLPRTILLSVLTLSACSPSGATTRNFPIGGFDRVAASAPVDVRVHVGSAPSASASGPQNVLDRLVIEVRNGELVVGTKPGLFTGWRSSGRVYVDVTVPALNGATLTGPGNLAIDHVRARTFTARLSGPGDMSVAALQADHITADLSGPGDLTLAGNAASASVSLSGPGNVHGSALTLRDAEVSLSGPGDIALTASGQVRGRLSGPGDIRITGGAHCSISKSGPGDVSC